MCERIFEFLRSECRNLSARLALKSSLQLCVPNYPLSSDLSWPCPFNSYSTFLTDTDVSFHHPIRRVPAWNTVPMSGTVLYCTTSHNLCANIDHFLKSLSHALVSDCLQSILCQFPSTETCNHIFRNPFQYLPNLLFWYLFVDERNRG